jgi:hypothetical protein
MGAIQLIFFKKCLQRPRSGRAPKRFPRINCCWASKRSSRPQPSLTATPGKPEYHDGRILRSAAALQQIRAERRAQPAGAILKDMGAKLGVPDLLLISRGRFFAIELKSDRGRLSLVQRETHSAMRKAGAIIGVAGDVDQAIDLLIEWGLLR